MSTVQTVLLALAQASTTTTTSLPNVVAEPPGTDAVALSITAGAALLGAIVGGGATYFAAIMGMRHEAKLRRKERLREVRAEMVNRLTPLMFEAHRGISGISALNFKDQMIEIERIAYAATPEDQGLTSEARREAQRFLGADDDLKSNRGPLDANARYNPPQMYVDALDVSRANLENAMQRLDDHLLSQLTEKSDGHDRSQPMNL